jgi:hypothetical protein
MQVVFDQKSFVLNLKASRPSGPLKLAMLFDLSRSLEVSP